jgi:hypothetical protein
VLVGTDEGFDHATKIDGRWVHAVPRERLERGQYITTLNAAVMARVSAAVREGLQLDKP